MKISKTESMCLPNAKLIFICKNKKEMKAVANQLHKQLKNNREYQKNNIMVITSRTFVKQDASKKFPLFSKGNNVYVWVFDNTELPSLKIKPERKRKKKKK